VNPEWTTPAENIMNAYDTGLISRRRQSKAVIDLCTGRRFKTVRQVADFHGIAYTTFKHYMDGQWPNPTSLEYA